ncbi:MAG: hypothetical protein AAB610_03085 [Patescibacteria group bacterium]
MEDFKKLVYKDPVLQVEDMKSSSPEEIEYSESVAYWKLSKIENPEFRDFSVRYVNLEEYKRILETGEFDGQVILHGQSDGRPFVDFKNWARWGIDKTNWVNISGVSVGVADNLLSIIKSVEHEHKDEGKDAKLEKIRDSFLEVINRMRHYPFRDNVEFDTLEKGVTEIVGSSMVKDIKNEFQNYIKDKQGSFIWDKASDFIDNFSERHPSIILNDEEKERLNQYLLNLVEELRFGRSNINIFFKLKNNPEYIKEKGALREIVNALTYLQDSEMMTESRQYEVALILDDAVFGFKAGGDQMWDESWGSFKASKNHGLPTEERKKGLLAAISIMPLKELSEEMKGLEKGTGDFAHPIFDNKGRLKWPKK